MRVSTVVISLVVFTIGNLHLTSCSPLADNQKYPIMNVLHLGDYIEAVTGVTAACANVSQTENIEKKLINTFSTCLSKISGDKPTEFLGQLVTICNHQDKYIPCWEQLNKDILKECGKDKEPLLPALYVGTVIAFCGSDLGEKRIDELKNASNDREVAKSCPNVEVKVLQSFQEHCVNLLADMKSPRFCIRRKAIQKCVDQLFSIVCTDPLPTFFNIYKNIYGDTTGLLQCDN